nr:MarR family transcriptional regulator [Catenulispora pinisilvae]
MDATDPTDPPEKPIDPLEGSELTFLLGMAFQLVLSEFVRRLDVAGYSDLRPMHGLVFQALGTTGSTSTELAEKLSVTKQAAGQIVDDLEERQYVRRLPHPAGGRRKLVMLTDKALRHLTVAGTVLRELEEELNEKLGERGLTMPRAGLAAVIRTMAGEDLPPLRPLW